MYILLVGLIFEGISVNSRRILMAKAQHGRIAVVWLFLSILSIPLSIVGATVWGVPGATLGAVFVTIIGYPVMIWMTCSVMKVSMITYFRETFMRLLLPLLLLSVLLLLMVIYFPAENYLGLILQILVPALSYALSVFFLVLGVSERNKILNFSGRFF